MAITKKSQIEATEAQVENTLALEVQVEAEALTESKIPESITITRSAFGKKKETVVALDQVTGAPRIWTYNDDGSENELILGLTKAAFAFISTAKAREIALIEYEIAQEYNSANIAKAAIIAHEEKIAELVARKEEVETGKKSKASLEAEEKALLAKLDKIRAQM